MALLVRLKDNLARGNKAAPIAGQRFDSHCVRGTMLLKVRQPRALITAIETFIRFLTHVDTLVHDQITRPRTRIRALIAGEHLSAGFVVRSLIFKLLILRCDICIFRIVFYRFHGCRSFFGVPIESIFDVHEFLIPRMHLFVVVELLEFSAGEFAFFTREKLVVVVDGFVVLEVFRVLGGEGALIAAVGLAVAGHGDRCGRDRTRGWACTTRESGAFGGALGLAALVVALQEADVCEDSVAETAGVPVDYRNIFLVMISHFRMCMH